MKVLCIDENAYPSDESFDFDDENIKDGNVYDVVDYRKFNGHLFFCVSEFFDKWFYSGCFMPISNIDEKELIKERELLTEKV